MSKPAGGLASLIVFALCGTNLNAADAIRVEPVVVSATRSLQSSVPTPAAISIIGRQECRYAREAFRPSCPRNALA